MSRSNCSYDEDWQRRKATLIRSLFHDIEILSPVQEESNESSTYKPTEGALDVPHQPLDVDDRPESPLPPLIIERVPNRHDEPEEYYDELLKKIRRIYRKLFIENKDLSIEDLDLNSWDCTINSDDDYFEMSVDNYENGVPDYLNPDVNDIQNPELGIETFDSLYENDNRESSNSANSDEYAACSELSPSTEELIDVENYSKSDEDVHMRTEEDEESGNDHEMNDTENDLGKSQFTSETSETDKVTGDQEGTETEESSHLNICNEETSTSEESNITRIEDGQIMENPEFYEDHNKIEIYQEINENQNTKNIENYNIETRGERRSFDNGNNLISAEVGAMEEDTSNSSGDGPEYMQITTEAIVHMDGRSDAVEKESRIYEDSVKSLILPAREYRRVMKVRYTINGDSIEELSELEENEDPDTTFNSAESEHNLEPIEVMRTPQPKISNDSIPITARTESHITSEHTEQSDNAELASLPSSQDDDNNITQPKTSDEMTYILNSIFNESLNKDAETSIKRKRKIYEDTSVQTTQGVTWDKLRANFFIGTPKIFRLCACANHVCI